MEKRRKSKLTDAVGAMELISDGMTVAIGGHSFFNKPCHLVRQLAKRGVRDLTLSASPYAGYDYDLLISVGAARRVLAGNVGFEYLGLAPNFRKACQDGTVETVLCDEATLVGGYMASAEGVSFHPIASLFGSDVIKNNPQIKEITGPFDGKPILAVRAIIPDVLILHALQSDEYGNIRNFGGGPFDVLMAKASRKVIVSVEEVIGNGRVLREPEQTAIPGFMVSAVVEAPFGAHPYMCMGSYVHDEDHIRDYIQRARSSLSGGNPQPFAEYLRQYVQGPETIYDYVGQVGGTEKMMQLRRAWSYGEG